jgi:putative ABC transport system substrate-binding protein
MEGAAQSLGVTLRDAPCRDEAGIEATMAALAQTGNGGLLAIAEVFNVTHRQAIATLALKHKIATHVFTPEMIESGGLMAYMIDYPDLFRRSADYINRIFKGEMPANLPVQAPTKFHLTINLRTANALGLVVSPTLLATADKIIE